MCEKMNVSNPDQKSSSLSSDFKIKFVNEPCKKQLDPMFQYDCLAPGEIIKQFDGFLGGHGTYESDGFLKTSVAGIVQQVGKLISVKSFKGRYVAEIGDLIVGRIIEVQQKRWLVDTNSRLNSVLLLSSINLLGGESRRRCDEDEKKMRNYFEEGDLISAEVYSIFDDGTLSLSIRSLIYGKLSQGVLVQVLPALIKRSKIYFHTLNCGATVILGKNGNIWIGPTSNLDENFGEFVQNFDTEISLNDRQTIIRLRNCILALAENEIMLYETSILSAFEESKKYLIDELIDPNIMRGLALSIKQQLAQN